MLASFSRTRLRVTALALACTVMLAGCATQTAYDPNLSPAQNQLRQANQRFNQTVGEGAVAGAVIGGLAGLALGGRNRAQTAAIGAAAGGALGAGAGYMVARNNLNRSSTEAQFNDAIQQASADADMYQRSASASQQVADQAEADAARLRSQVQARQITQAQYRAGMAKYQADANAMNTLASKAREQAAALRQDARVAPARDRGTMSGLASNIDAAGQQQERTAARMSRLLAGAES